MRAKTIFVCQVSDNSLKVIKVTSGNIVNLEVEPLAPDSGEKKAAEKISAIFKKLKYSGSPVIIALPRNSATCRCIKIPAQAPDEIEKIVALQAPRYLPYPVNLLITGYQIIAKDKEGNSYLNLIIVHKDIIERYFRLFKEVKADNPSIVLSSYGISNFYYYLKPEDQSPVSLIDLDLNQAELAIVSKNRLYYSRYFKLDMSMQGWEAAFIEEIKKTHDAYLKEVTGEVPTKIIVSGAGKILNKFVEILKNAQGLPVEIILFADKINIAKGLINNILDSQYSFTVPLGLGIKESEESLNLIPQDIKEARRRQLSRREKIRIGLFIFLTAIFIGAGIAKNMYNRIKYLTHIRTEIDKVTKDARPLEILEKKINLLEGVPGKKVSGLSLLYELHKIMPAQTLLINFTYEDGKQVILRGQAPKLDSVVSLNSALENSQYFKNFNIGIRYTTHRKTQAGDFVDFEILCVAKK